MKTWNVIGGIRCKKPTPSDDEEVEVLHSGQGQGELYLEEEVEP